MLALIFDGHVRLDADYPTPRRGADEVLARVLLAGVCKTDLEIVKGYMGFRGVMGHEFVAEVAEGPEQWRGKRVVAEINCVCGKCDMCAAGLANHCPTRTVLGIDGRDGVFAEYVALPAANLHEVPETVPDEAAVFVEPLAAAFQVLKQVEIAGCDHVVVLGDGRLGQLVARVLRLRTDRLLLVGKHAEKLALARQKGINTVAADEYAPHDDADLVVDATGSQSGFELAIAAVKPRGRIVLKSTFAAGADAGGIDLAPLVIKEVTVIGSRCGPFEDAIASLASGEVEVLDLISKRMPLSAGPAALEAAADTKNLKVILEVGRKARP